MMRPVHVEPLPGYRIRVRFDDGSEGEVDLSRLVGEGVFAAWNDYRCFEKVHLGSGGGISWNDEIELCPDAIHMRITGKTPEELVPALRGETAYA